MMQRSSNSQVGAPRKPRTCRTCRPITTPTGIEDDPDYVRVYVDGLYGYVKDGKPVYSEYNDKECTVRRSSR